MERELTKLNAHNGFALVTVLSIAAVGLLIGAGSLLLFRFQCEKRIDRQHEIEKYFAVRSALQLLAEGNLSNFPDEMSGPKRFVYQTDSGRDVRVIISPAKVLFPDYNYEFPDGKRHFYMNFQTIAPHPILPNSYIKSPVSNYNPGTARYRFFTEAMTNTEFSCEGNYLSLMHGSECSTSNGVPRCWLKIDMSPTGRWSDDLFGRRYMFNLHESCEFKLMSLEDNASVITNDIYRLVLKRTTKNEEYPCAINDGDWRPKEDGEAVIYVELRSWQTYSNKVCYIS